MNAWSVEQPFCWLADQSLGQSLAWKGLSDTTVLAGGCLTGDILTN